MEIGARARISALTRLRTASPEIATRAAQKLSNMRTGDPRFLGNCSNLVCRALDWKNFLHGIKELVRVGDEDAEAVLKGLSLNPVGIARLTNEKLKLLNERVGSLLELACEIQRINPGQPQEKTPARTENIEKHRTTWERITGLLEQTPSLSDRAGKHDEYVENLKQVISILLLNGFPAQKVIAIFEEISAKAREFHAASNGERRNLEIELRGMILEIIGIADLIKRESAERVADPITDFNKDMGAIEFFLPEVEITKEGKIIVRPGTEKRTEPIQADGWREGSKTLIEEKSCMEFGWIQGNGNAQEERFRVCRLTAQIAKYGRALQKGIIKGLELNISAPKEIDPDVIKALVNLIPKECHDRVKIFQRVSILPPSPRVRVPIDDGEPENALKDKLPEKGEKLFPKKEYFVMLGDEEASSQKLLVKLIPLCQSLAKRITNGEIDGVTFEFRSTHLSHKVLRVMRRIFGRNRKKVEVLVFAENFKDLKQIPLGKPMRKKKRQGAAPKISDTSVLSSEHLKVWEWMCKFWKDVKFSTSDTYGSVKFKLHSDSKKWSDFAGEMLFALNSCLDEIIAKKQLSDEDKNKKELIRIKKEVNDSRGQFIGRKTFLNISPLTQIVFPLCAKVMVLAEKHK